MKKLFIALLILCVVTPLLGQTENTPDNTVAATVNGDVIYMDTFLSKVLPSYTEISRSIEKIDPLFSEVLVNSQAGKAVLEEYEKRALEVLIEETFIMQYAEELGIKVDLTAIRATVNKSIMDTLTELNIERADADLFYVLKGYIDGLNSYESSVVRDLAYKEVLNALYETVTENATVTEEEIVQYYQANSSKYAVDQERVSLKLLLFDSFSEAYSIWKTASRDSNPGAALDSFPDVQSDNFTRPEIEALNPELVKTLFKPTKGELLSSVVTLDNKYAVIYLVSYTPAGTKGVAEMKNQIQEELIAEKKSLMWRLWKEKEFKPFKEKSVVERYYDNEGE